VRYCYLDSSALAKAYLLETGTRQIQDLLRSARTATPTVRALVSALSSLEITSAILRKQDSHEITRSEASRAVDRVQADFSITPPPDATPYQVIFPGPGVLQHSQGLMTVYRLRTYDAIHLATAIAARASLPVESRFVFVGCDDDLCTAAAAEGIEVYDPSE
jgi:predicted nucleic acid-binding protein